MGASIKLNKALWGRVKQCAEAGGYDSPEAFIEHVLERELAKLEPGASDDDIARKLQGLGYLD